MAASAVPAPAGGGAALGDFDDYHFSFKVVIVGDSSSGKAQLLDSEGAASRDTDGDTTAAAGSLSFRIKTYELNGLTFLVQYWDLPSSDRFVKMAPRFAAGAAGGIFCYNVCDRYSFERVAAWIGETERTPRFASVLVGTRGVATDAGSAAPEREVALEQGESLASMHNMAFSEVDLASGLGVEDVFQSVLAQVARVIPTPTEPSMLLRTGIKLGRKLLTNRSFKRSLYAGGGGSTGAPAAAASAGGAS